MASDVHEPSHLSLSMALSNVANGDATPHVAVSILIPSYNSSPYITDAVRSALRQGTSIEVIVQDGGSTDGTAEALAQLVDPRLLVIVEPDGGQSDALNRALGRASGEFVVWLNADDLILDGAVEALVAAARDEHLDIVHGDYDIIAASGPVLKRYSSAPLDRVRLIRHGVYIFSGALLIRRRLLVGIGGFDANLHYAMDLDLLLRLAEAHRGSGQISQIVAQFRRQPESKSESVWLPFLREIVVIGRRHGATHRQTMRRITIYLAYMGLRPLWRSRAWLRIRPSKHLGGR